MPSSRNNHLMMDQESESSCQHNQPTYEEFIPHSRRILSLHLFRPRRTLDLVARRRAWIRQPSTHNHFDGQDVVNNVTAAVAVMLGRLSSAQRICRFCHQCCFPRFCRRFPIILPKSPRVLDGLASQTGDVPSMSTIRTKFHFFDFRVRSPRCSMDTTNFTSAN